MKKRLILLLSFVPFAALSQTMAEWDDVNVTSLNRIQSHDLSIPFETAEDAHSLDLTKSPYFLDLNGTWKFHWSKTPTAAPSGFYADEYDVSGWDDITVPMPWQVYGFRNNKSWDKPLYVNTRYPFTYTSDWSVMASRPNDYTYNEQMKNPVGCYRRTFTLPEGWTARKTFLRFNGAGHGYYVWVNGQFAGYAEDSYLPSDFDVSDFVREGENNVSVQVYRFTSGSFLECQDYWRLTGITRDVYLWSAPETRIGDFFFQTTKFNTNGTSGQAKLQVALEGGSLSGMKLQMTISDGETVVKEYTRSITTSTNITQSISFSGIEAWSAGNESGGGNNFQSVMQAIKALDTSRITHYEGNSQWSDVTSTMYGSYENMLSTGKSRKGKTNQKPHIQKPHIQCENTHAMGNSMGNEIDYYRDIYEPYPAMVGEFVWDWKDQGLKKPVPGKTNQYFWAYGGDFGDNPNDGNFCCNGVVLPDCTPTAKSFNMKGVYQPLDILPIDAEQGTFKVKNKLQQINFNGYDVQYVISEDGIQIASGMLDNLDLAPWDSTTISVPYEGITFKPSSLYTIRFSTTLQEETPWAEAGYEVAASEAIIKEPTAPLPYAYEGTDTLSISGTTSKTVKGAGFTATFSGGTLSKYVLDGTTLINQPIKLNTFRIPTENDGRQESNWESLGVRALTMTSGTWEVEQDEANRWVQLSITDTYTTSTQALVFTVNKQFRVYPDGTISVSTVTTPNIEGSVLPKLGFRFEMPYSAEHITWLGRGPFDSYLDRKYAAHLGIYHSTVTEQWTNHIRPQETGNKEDVRWLAVTTNAGKGLMFANPSGMATTVGHWRAEDIYTAPWNRKGHPYEVTFPRTTVVSLDAWNRALGNASCGPDVLDKYERKLAQTPFCFMIMPIHEETSDTVLTQRGSLGLPVCQPVRFFDDGHGFAILTSDNPTGTIIYYSIDGSDFQPYTEPLDMRGGGLLRAYAQAEGLAESIITEKTYGFFVDKSEWTIYSYDSQQGGNELATNAIDDKDNTIWHTQYNPQTPDCPHELVIDMKQYYRVTAFAYKGRSDGSNGRVQRYEVYFTNNPHVWGEPAASGTFNNTADKQTVSIPSKPEARYMKFLVRTTHDGRGYASAAELYVEAEAMVPQNWWWITPINTEHHYRIREKQSGLCLHYQTHNNEGHFCLGNFDENDQTYIFTFEQAQGFTAFFRLKANGHYMSYDSSAGWRIISTTTQPTDKNGWIQVERLEEGNAFLRCGWQNSRVVGFDSRNVGSYIYADKTVPGEFILEDIEAEADGMESLSSSPDGEIQVYDMLGRKIFTPTAGIYIERHPTGKARKKLVK